MYISYLDSDYSFKITTDFYFIEQLCYNGIRFLCILFSTNLFSVIPLVAPVGFRLPEFVLTLQQLKTCSSTFPALIYVNWQASLYADRPNTQKRETFALNSCCTDLGELQAFITLRALANLKGFPKPDFRRP